MKRFDPHFSLFAPFLGTFSAGFLACSTAAAAGDVAFPPLPVLDGSFAEWDASTHNTGLRLQIDETDPIGDTLEAFLGVEADQDLTRVQVVSAGTTVWVRYRLNNEVNAQTTNDPGILRFRFTLPGGRAATYSTRSRSLSVDGGPNLVWTEADFISMPTPASDQFEFRLDLAHPEIGARPGDTIVFEAVGADELASPVSFTLDRSPEIVRFRDPGRWPCTEVRLASLNTLFQGLGNPARAPSLERLIAAAAADIYVFQEQSASIGIDFNADPPTPVTVADRLNELDPLGDGRPWTVVSNALTNTDDLIASHWPLRALPLRFDPSNNTPGGSVTERDMSAAVVERPQERGGPLLVFSYHPRCCGTAGSPEDISRILASARIEGYTNSFRAGDYGPDFDPFTDAPVIVMGDWNLVGSFFPLQVLTLDDGLDLVDWPVTGLDGRDAGTWRHEDNRRGGFWPGRLDLIAHDKVLTRRNGFVLDTARLSDAARAAFGVGLLGGDSLASDHLIFAADFGREPRADLNADGMLTPADFTAWLRAFTRGQASADLDDDGDLTPADFNAWLGAYRNPCSG